MNLKHASRALLLLLALLSPAAPAFACQSLPIVYFQAGSDSIGPDGQAALQGFALQALHGLDRIAAIRVIGHSDRTGSRSARRRIAVRRAEAVRDHLFAYGIPAALVEATGVSDSRPALATADRMREPLNRRAELAIAVSAEADAGSSPVTCLALP